MSLALLEATAVTHQRFTALGLADASVAELVSVTAVLGGAQVVFSDALHRVVAIEVLDGSPNGLIERWRSQELQRSVPPKVSVEEASDVAVARVEVKGRLRGLLTLLPSSPVSAVQVMVLERGAAAIAMQLNGVSDERLREETHRSLLADLLSARASTVETATARASAMGHGVGVGRMAVVVVECDDGDVGEQVVRVFAHLRHDAIVGVLGHGRWGVLVMLPQTDDAAFDRAAEKLHLLAASSDLAVRVARGGYVDDPAGIRHSYVEALEVADAVRDVGSAVAYRGCHTIRDVGLRGLLVALRDDPRVLAFAERMLRPLLERDRREAGGWVSTLEVYLRAGGSKSVAAIELGISRQTLYQRLSRIRRMLEMDIDDSEIRTSLHVAMMTIQGAGTPQRDRINSL